MARVLTVQELVEATRNGLGFRTLSERAGGVPAAPTMSQLARRPPSEWTNAMGPDLAEGYAKALGVTVRTMWLANGASLSLDVGEEDSLVFQLRVPGLETVTDPADIAHLRREMAWCVEKARLRGEGDTLRARVAELEPSPRPRRAAKQH